MSATMNGMARTAACLGIAATVMLGGCGGNRSFSLGSDGLGLGAPSADPGDGTGGTGTGGTGTGGTGGGAGGTGGTGGTGTGGTGGGTGGTGGGSGGGGTGGSGGGAGGGGASGGGAPLSTAGLNDVLNSLGRVTVGDKTVLGGGSGAQTSPLGVSVLSPTQSAGGVATVGVLSGGQVLNVGVGQGNASSTPTGGTPTSLLGLTVAGQPVLGGGVGDPAIDLGLLSPGAAQGTAASVNLLSNGQPVGVSLGGGGASGLLGGALTPVTSGPLTPVVAPVVATVTGLVGGLTGTLTGGVAGGVGAGVGVGAGPGGATVGGGLVGGLTGGLTGGLLGGNGGH